MKDSQISVKVQLWGPKLYKEQQDIKQEESYLPRLFKLFYFKWHTFLHIHTVFWCLIFLSKHRKSPLKDR